MQVNWSLVLNILLLIAVMFAIVRLVITRRKRMGLYHTPSSAEPKPAVSSDEIVAVRKIHTESQSPAPKLSSEKMVKKGPVKLKNKTSQPSAKTIMILLSAKENRQFAGYELLQTLLSVGLRFGEGQLFHRHQFANGQGPILCSLAAATSSGVFDLQNIGAFSVRGLCLFMHASDNQTIDEERFTILLDTARQLSESLDAHLLDDQRKPLTEEGIGRYYQLLNLQVLA